SCILKGASRNRSPTSHVQSIKKTKSDELAGQGKVRLLIQPFPPRQHSLSPATAWRATRIVRGPNSVAQLLQSPAHTIGRGQALRQVREPTCANRSENPASESNNLASFPGYWANEKVSASSEPHRASMKSDRLMSCFIVYRVAQHHTEICRV